MPDSDPSIPFEIVAWFSPTKTDIEQDGKIYRIGYCRVCNKEITRHVLVDETATPEELVEAREAGHRDGETFFAHLYTAHRELFGEDGPSDFVAN